MFSKIENKLGLARLARNVSGSDNNFRAHI